MNEKNKTQETKRTKREKKGWPNDNRFGMWHTHADQCVFTFFLSVRFYAVLGMQTQARHKTKINKKKNDIWLHFTASFFPKIDLGYLMLPLNNILTFIHKVTLLNYWGRKRDLDFLFFFASLEWCSVCVYAGGHVKVKVSEREKETKWGYTAHAFTHG